MAMMTPFRWDYRVAGPLSRKRRKKPFLGIDPGLAEQDRTTQQSFTDFPINTVRGRGGPDNRHRHEDPLSAIAGGLMDPLGALGDLPAGGFWLPSIQRGGPDNRHRLGDGEQGGGAGGYPGRPTEQHKIPIYPFVKRDESIIQRGQDEEDEKDKLRRLIQFAEGGYDPVENWAPIQSDKGEYPAGHGHPESIKANEEATELSRRTPYTWRDVRENLDRPYPANQFSNLIGGGSDEVIGGHRGFIPIDYETFEGDRAREAHLGASDALADEIDKQVEDAQEHRAEKRDFALQRRDADIEERKKKLHEDAMTAARGIRGSKHFIDSGQGDSHYAQEGRDRNDRRLGILSPLGRESRRDRQARFPDVFVGENELDLADYGELPDPVTIGPMSRKRKKEYLAEREKYKKARRAAYANVGVDLEGAKVDDGEKPEYMISDQLYQRLKKDPGEVTDPEAWELFDGIKREAARTADYITRKEEDSKRKNKHKTRRDRRSLQEFMKELRERPKSGSPEGRFPANSGRPMVGAAGRFTDVEQKGFHKWVDTPGIQNTLDVLYQGAGPEFDSKNTTMEELLGDKDIRGGIRNLLAGNDPAYSEKAINNMKLNLFNYLLGTYFSIDPEDRDSGFGKVNELLDEFFGDRTKEHSLEDQMNFLDKIFSEEAEYFKLPKKTDLGRGAFDLATPGKSAFSGLGRAWYGIGI